MGSAPRSSIGGPRLCLSFIISRTSALWDHLLGGGDGRFVRTLEPHSPKRSTFRLLLNPTSCLYFKETIRAFTLELYDLFV